MTMSDQKETVTVSFISNHEVDPDKFDLRYKDPMKIREQLRHAASSKGRPQQVCGHDEASLLRYREEIKKAKETK